MIKSIRFIFIWLPLSFTLLSSSDAFVINSKKTSLEQLTPKEIYQKYSKAVVLIIASKEGKKTLSIGTGSIILVKEKNGLQNLILTNAHVISDDDGKKPMTDIRVYLKPEKITGNWKDDLKKSYKATPLVYNQPLDLALLKVDGNIGSSSILFADSNTVEVGDQVVAIGHPEQGGIWTLTTGTIGSQKTKLDNVEGKDVFQTDASINRGNSGGPLINIYGGLVGVNTSIARRSADGLAITGINFALKSSAIEKWMMKAGYTAAGLEIVKDEEKGQKASEKPQPKDSTAHPAQPPAERKKEEPLAQPKIEQKKLEMKVEQKQEQPKKEGVILTEKRPYKFDDLIDYLMEAQEKKIDEDMDKMWKKF